MTRKALLTRGFSTFGAEREKPTWSPIGPEAVPASACRGERSCLRLAGVGLNNDAPATH